MQNHEFSTGVNVAHLNQYDDLEPITFDADSYEVDTLELNEFDNFARETGKRLKHLGRDRRRKTALLYNVKCKYPNFDLTKLIDDYTSKTDHFEDYENYEIAQQIEDHFSLKKLAKKAGKVAKKGIKVVGKVAKITAPIVAGIAMPGVGGAIISKGTQLMEKATKLKKVVKTVKDVKAIAKKTGMTVAQVKQAVKNPTIAQVQAIAPTNAVESVLSQLVPLETSMRKGLASKGITANNETMLEDLATQFHKKVVGSSSFDDNWYENDQMYYESIESYEGVDNLDNSQAQKIVNDIITYFKTGTSKPATAVQAVLAKEAQAYQQEKKKDELKELNTQLKASTPTNSNNKIIIFAIIGVVAFILFKKL